MPTTHGASTCRYGVPTLFLASPAWTDAADRPWTCVRDQHPHELESTDVCASCTQWEARPETAADTDAGIPRPYFLDILAH